MRSRSKQDRSHHAASQLKIFTVPEELHQLRASRQLLAIPNIACATANTFNKMKIAVLLSGSGVYDGSEITESTAVLIHLSRAGCEYECFAPDQDQMHVVNHITGEPMEGETRNVLVESARIARGSVKALGELKVQDFDAIVVPGGFYVAKNLCNLAVKGKDMEVDPVVDKVLKDFHRAKKHIGLSCIAPVLGAKSLPDGVKITMGMESGEDFPHSWAIPAAQAMGATHVPVNKPATDAVVDFDNKVVSCVAYMYSGKPHEIYDTSVGNLIDEVVKMISE
jgi:enhancing lycopene biosynthesis protein 2